eukprot:s1559_g27.t1
MVWDDEAILQHNLGVSKATLDFASAQTIHPFLPVFQACFLPNGQPPRSDLTQITHPDISDGTNQSDDDTGNVSESNDSDGSSSNDSETSDSFNASPETHAAQDGALLEDEDNESYNESNDSNGTNFSLQADRVGTTSTLPTTMTLTTSLVYVRGRFIEEISAFTGDPPTILTSYLLSPEALPHMVRTSFTDQSTPAAAKITDVDASASSIQFTDYDLDETQIGGTVSFLPPIDMQFVEALQIKLAYGSPSEIRSQIGETILATRVSSTEALHR